MLLYLKQNYFANLFERDMFLNFPTLTTGFAPFMMWLHLGGLLFLIEILHLHVQMHSGSLLFLVIQCFPISVLKDI